MDRSSHSQKQSEDSHLRDPVVPLPPDVKALPPTSLLGQQSPDFVGRERELAELRSTLEAACAGQGRLVLLVGEPGIGKTRLADEVTTLARQQGLLVLWGRCWEGDGAPAFWPWTQIVRTYMQQSDPDTLAADMGPGAADIAQVIPAVREQLPWLSPSAELEPAQARFRFFDSFTTFFKNLGQRQPLVLILDDLHWADTSSLQLLHFFTRELRNVGALVIGAYRDVEVHPDHPLADTFAGLTREGQCVELGGLSEAAITQFISHTTGITPAITLVKTISEQTNGNPFFVSQIVGLLSAEEQFKEPQQGSDSPFPLPQGVRDTIRLRLRQLSEGCRRLLSIASVIGREFGLDLLTQVSGEQPTVNHEPILGLLDEARSARLIDEVADSVGHYRFIHALVRETLYEDLTLTDRIHLHAQIGEAIETLYGAHLESHLAELADHFFKATPGGNRAKAVQYASRAGAYATARLAYEEAAGHYQQALQALGLRTPDLIRRGNLLLALGEVQMKAGETAQARATLLHVADLARQLRTPEARQHGPSLLAQAALGLSGVWVGTGIGVVDETLVGLLEEARDALGEEESSLQVKVLARLAAELRGSAPRAQRAALSQQAVDMARRIGDQATLAYALAARYWALWGPENLEDRIDTAREIVVLAEADGDKAMALVGRTWYLTALLERGDMPAVDREIAAVTQLAEELRQPFYRWWSTGLPIMRALMEGRFEGLEQRAQETLAVGERVQAPDRIQSFGAQMAMRYGLQGRLQDFAPAIMAFVEQYPTVSTWQCVLAHLHSELGHREDAQQTLNRLSANNFVDLPQDELWCMSVVVLSEVCDFLSDERCAAMLYELLLPYADRNIVVGPAVLCYGAAARHLGILAMLLSRWEEAERHFEHALTLNTKISALPFVAQTQHDYARMLVARNQREDGEKAGRLLDGALNTAQTLGMQGLLKQVTALKEHLPDREGGQTTYEGQGGSLPDAGAVHVASLSPQENLVRQDGTYWTLVFDRVTIRLRNVKGFHYLAHLLQHPGQEFHVFDLLALTAKQPAASSPGVSTQPQAQQHLAVAHPASSLLADPHALTAYKQRLADCQEELEEAERFNDPARAAQAQAEIDFITNELTTAYGLSRHKRNATVEKARKAVTNRIRTSLAQTKNAHPALWQHLLTSIKTGTFCSYNPEQPTIWQG